LGRRLRSASVKTADQCCPLVNHVEYTFTRLRSASVKTTAIAVSATRVVQTRVARNGRQIAT